MNKLELIGRIGNDLEVKKIKDDFNILEMSLATNEKWKDKNTQEEKEKTDWHVVKFFGSTVDNAKKFKKGDLVKVSGKLNYDEYDDKNGSKQKRAYLHCFSIEEGLKKNDENTTNI